MFSNRNMPPFTECCREVLQHWRVCSWEPLVLKKPCRGVAGELARFWMRERCQLLAWTRGQPWRCQVQKVGPRTWWYHILTNRSQFRNVVFSPCHFHPCSSVHIDTTFRLRVPGHLHVLHRSFRIVFICETFCRPPNLRARFERWHGLWCECSWYLCSWPADPAIDLWIVPCCWGDWGWCQTLQSSHLQLRLLDISAMSSSVQACPWQARIAQQP